MRAGPDTGGGTVEPDAPNRRCMMMRSYGMAVLDGRSEKRRIRRDMKKRLDAMAQDTRLAAARGVAARLDEAPAIARATVVMAYLSFGTELNAKAVVRRLLKMGKRVCVPRTDWDAGTITPVELTGEEASIVEGRYGVPEPADAPAVHPGLIEVVLVPGLAFDREGGRLGRGAGFYDRFLRGLQEARATPAALVGVGFDEQVIDRVPLEAHDVRMGEVLTPGARIVCSGGG